MAVVLGLLGVGALGCEAVERHFVQLANENILSVAIMSGTTLGLHFALLLLRRRRKPAVHDPFRYLLGTDAFATGGANPSHPKTFAINPKPIVRFIFRKLFSYLSQLSWECAPRHDAPQNT